MTLSAGTGYNAVGREIFGFAPQIDFSAAVSNTDRTAFDFTSPMQLYLCEMQPSINTAGMAANDILSFSLQGNGLSIFQTKFALAAASEPIQDDTKGCIQYAIGNGYDWYRQLCVPGCCVCLMNE